MSLSWSLCASPLLEDESDGLGCLLDQDDDFPRQHDQVGLRDGPQHDRLVLRLLPGRRTRRVRPGAGVLVVRLCQRNERGACGDADGPGGEHRDVDCEREQVLFVDCDERGGWGRFGLGWVGAGRLLCRRRPPSLKETTLRRPLPPFSLSLSVLFTHSRSTQTLSIHSSLVSSFRLALIPSLACIS